VITPKNFTLPFADVPPPPTFVADSIYLGWPVGPIVGLALSAGAIFGFFWLRRHMRWWVAGLLTLVGYGAANIGIYVYVLNAIAAERQQLREQQRRNRATSTQTSGERI